MSITQDNVFLRPETSGLFNEFTIKQASKFLGPKTSPDSLSNDINITGDAVGAAIYIVNKNYDVLYATNKFYLTGFSFSLKERAQLLDSFTSPILSFMDQAVRVYNINGVGADAGSTDSSNSSKNYQHSSLIDLYNNKLRGTQLVKNGNIGILRVGNHTVFGYPLNLNTGYSSSADKTASFTLAWAVAKHTLDTPGVVTLENLDDMTNVTKFINSSITNFKELLSRYRQFYQNVASTLPVRRKLYEEDLVMLNNYIDQLQESYKDLISTNLIFEDKDNFFELLSNSRSHLKNLEADPFFSWDEDSPKNKDKYDTIVESLDSFIVRRWSSEG